MIKNEVSFLRTLKYKKNISEIDLINKAMYNIFIFIKNWAEYKIPKILMTMHTLQEYICNK